MHVFKARTVTLPNRLNDNDESGERKRAGYIHISPMCAKDKILVREGNMAIVHWSSTFQNGWTTESHKDMEQSVPFHEKRRKCMQISRGWLSRGAPCQDAWLHNGVRQKVFEADSLQQSIFSEVLMLMFMHVYIIVKLTITVLRVAMGPITLCGPKKNILSYRILCIV